MAFPALNPQAPHLTVERRPRYLYKRVAFSTLTAGTEAIDLFTLPDNTIILDAFIVTRVPGAGGTSQTLNLRIKGGATFLTGTLNNVRTAAPNGKDRGTFAPQPRTDGEQTITGENVTVGTATTAPECYVVLLVWRPGYPQDSKAGGGSAPLPGVEHVQALDDPRLEIERRPCWIVRELPFTATGAGTETLDVFDLPEATIVLDAMVLCTVAGAGGTSQTGSLKIQGGATFLTGSADNLGSVGKQIADVGTFYAPQEPFATAGGNDAGTKTRVQMDNVRVGATSSAPTAIVALLVMRQNVGSSKLADVRARERNLILGGSQQLPMEEIDSEPCWLSVDAEFSDATGPVVTRDPVLRGAKGVVVLDVVAQLTRAPVGAGTEFSLGLAWDDGDAPIFGSLPAERADRTVGTIHRGNFNTIDLGNGPLNEEEHRNDDVNPPDLEATGDPTGTDTTGPAVRYAVLAVRPSYTHQGLARPSI